MYSLKCLFSGLFWFLLIQLMFSQKTIQVSTIHNGITRFYSFYVPANYVFGKPTPLVFNLHGYSSNGDQQEFYGDFRRIADTAGFIIVHPTGTTHPQTNQNFWNCGLIAGGGAVDDVGFIHAIIDTLSAAYSIDAERIYSTGMSNGGFMSYHLACVSKRFAAIASVTGSMTLQTVSQCSAGSPIPIMEIHGDADPVVNYNGAAGILSIPNVLEYWITKNGLNKQDLIQLKIPDINTSDGASAELFIYPGANEVQHYKILNGGHTWPGAFLPIGVTCQDFSASEVIWQFFAKYKRTSVASDVLSNESFGFYPNPAGQAITLKGNYQHEQLQTLYIRDGFGQIVRDLSTQSGHVIDIRDLPQGIYFIFCKVNNRQLQMKLIKM